MKWRFWQRPSDVERLLLLWDDVQATARLTMEKDANAPPVAKESAKAAFDTIHMELVSRLVEQAHRKAVPLKSSTVKKTTEETTTTG